MLKTNIFSTEKRDLLEFLLKDDGDAEPVNGIPQHNFQIDGKDAFALSFSQRRLWFLDQLEPGNAFYNFPLAVPFKIAVNTAVLERSINEIVRRHEALRTVFDTVDGEPVQVVLPDLKLPLPVVDLRALDKDAQDAEITRLAVELTQRPFDLARGPLLRTALVRRSPDDHVFLLVMHHIISDGWSLGIFWQELIALYNAFYVNSPSPLPDLQIQYADFAVWQREFLSGERLEALVSYWKHQLAGMSVLQLHADRPRPPMLSYRGASHELVLPRALADALRALSQREGATLFMTLFAAFTVLLQRYTGQDDIVVGSYVASRDRAELEDLIGFFINSLVLRADLSGDPSFRGLLGRVREMALDAYAHQDLPFEKLVEELQPERDLGRNPLFQVSFQLFSAQLDKATAAGSDGTPMIDLNRGMAIFDVAVNIWDGPDGLSGHIEYSTDLFEARTMARLSEHYRILLQSIVANPDTKLSALTILSAAEQRQLLVEWNETRVDIPPFRVHELFEQQVERSPDMAAVVVDGYELSYGELNRRANRLARRLRRLGVATDVSVGICFERGLDMVVAILAVLKAGGAYVPLDPSYPRDRLAFMLEDSGADIVLSHSCATDRLPRGADVLLIDDEAAFAAETDDNPTLAGTTHDLCYVIYTSGSTGRPKGVMGPHSGTVNRLHWMWRAYPFGPGEVVCQKTALSFVDSIWELFSGLLCGVRTVVLPDTTVKDPRKLVDALAAEGVSRIVIVPSLLRALLASGIDLAGELPRLRYWTVSGEAFPYDLYENFRQELPEATILNLYGSSEVAADVLCCDLGAIQMNSRTVPIGRPIANTAAYVLDRHANLVPAGVTGELYIGGAGLARGYHHRPELSAQSFVANPFADAPDRLLFKTGDKVRYRPDGQLEYLGRMDYQVKVRGYRIELGEIEMTLAALPQVREAVATVVQSGDDARLVAYVVPRTIAEASAAADSGAELTSRWRTVWDETYLNSADGDGSFNTVGWNSSFDGAPIPESEMREWVDQTVERVLSFAPRRVLEIGCGTGLILLRVAEHCEEYVATDFSRIALDHVRGEIAKLPERYAHVALFEREATDMDGLGDAFDLVILNSVIQYFPSVSYLRQVLRGAIGLTGPTGAVFVGDVRSSTLLKAFHASVELYRAADALRTDILRARIEKQMAHEEELVIAPTLFHEFAPDISQVTVDLKRGSSLNEVIQFRYDVALRRAAAALSPELWLDWNANALTQASVRAHLSDERPDSIGIAGIPNARIVAAMKAVDLLNGGLIETAGELRRVIDEQGRGGVDPEAMWVLGRELGYSVSVGWLDPGDGGRFDVVFRRGGSFGFPSACRHPAGDEEPRVADPLTTVFTQNLVAELRAWLQEKLPDHMVPSTILLLDRLPQTPNGKVDRGALPVPDTVRDGLPGAYEAPCGRTEKLLAAIWADVLNVDRVGVNDNFFEIGGHSLLAMQLVSRIRVELGNEMPVRAIFEAPTIATLAAKLDRETSSGGRALEPGIERVSRRVVKVVRPDGQINRLP